MMRTLLIGIVFGAQVSITGSLVLQAQDVDILAMASSLTAQSSELQKVRDQLQDRREEVKKTSQSLEQESKKLDKMKKAAQKDNDPGPLEGPYRLYTGAYSNDQSRRGQGESEAFGGPPQGGQEFQSLAEAHARAMEHMSGSNQPSFRIEDKNGRILESDGLFGGKRLPASRIANPPAPKAGREALTSAAAAIAAKKAALARNTQGYQAAKAEYDRRLAGYGGAVKKLTQTLPAADRDAGVPVPTVAQLDAPRGDYQVEDLKAMLAECEGKTVADGKATSFVREVAKVPDATKWARGPKVVGANLRAGTPIATFNEKGAFVVGKGTHCAIYITQNEKGIWVYDQFTNAKGEQRSVAARFIRQKNGGTPSTDAAAFSVIKKPARTSNSPARKR